MQVADKWVKRAEKKLFAMRMELNMGGMRAAVDDLNNKNVDEILDMPVGKTFKSASQMLSTDGGNLETLHQDMDAMLLVAPAPGERGLLDADAPTPEELEAEEAAAAAAAVAAQTRRRRTQRPGRRWRWRTSFAWHRERSGAGRSAAARYSVFFCAERVQYNIFCLS